MIIYYPVSALMTLFTNVLQNPQDARARSDIRLMRQVVSFLSQIAVDEETGGVKRMLSVCAEFERIAKIVVDKSEKEAHPRRKRKNNKDDEDDLSENIPEQHPTPYQTPRVPHTPTSSQTQGLTPGFTGDLLAQSFSPASNSFPSPHSTGDSNIALPNYVPQPGDFPNMFTEFSDINQFVGSGIASPGMGGYPQQYGPMSGDMWQMPMGLDWEWPNMQGDNFSGAADGAQANGQHEMQSADAMT